MNPDLEEKRDNLLEKASHAFRVARIWKPMIQLRGFLRDYSNDPNSRSFNFNYAEDEKGMLVTALGKVPLLVAERIMEDAAAIDILPGGGKSLDHALYFFDENDFLVIPNTSVDLELFVQAESFRKFHYPKIRTLALDETFATKSPFVVMFHIRSEAALRVFVDILVAEQLARHEVTAQVKSRVIESR